MNFLTQPTSETISQNSTKWKGEMRPQQLDGNEKKRASHLTYVYMWFGATHFFSLRSYQNVRLCQFISLNSSMPCIRIVNTGCTK